MEMRGQLHLLWWREPNFIATNLGPSAFCQRFLTVKINKYLINSYFWFLPVRWTAYKQHNRESLQLTSLSNIVVVLMVGTITPKCVTLIVANTIIETRAESTPVLHWLSTNTDVGWRRAIGFHGGFATIKVSLPCFWTYTPAFVRLVCCGSTIFTSSWLKAWRWTGDRWSLSIAAISC